MDAAYKIPFVPSDSIKSNDRPFVCCLVGEEERQ